MIKAVVFDMFETLVSIFSGDTYFSSHIASDLDIPIEIFQPEMRSTEWERSSGKYTIPETLKICLEKLGYYSEDSVRLITEKKQEAA